MKESFAIPDRKGTFPFVVLRLNMGLSFFVSTMKNIVNVISKEFHSLIFFLSQWFFQSISTYFKIVSLKILSSQEKKNCIQIFIHYFHYKCYTIMAFNLKNTISYEKIHYIISRKQSGGPPMSSTIRNWKNTFLILL